MHAAYISEKRKSERVGAREAPPFFILIFYIDTGGKMMISDLFKSICHDAPKRVIKRHDVVEESERLTRYQAQALSAEHEREREELDDIALFVRLVQRQRQRRG